MYAIPLREKGFWFWTLGCAHQHAWAPLLYSSLHLLIPTPMPRRKRDFMYDVISDSSGGSDNEIADDDDTYQRKRRRRSGDDDSEDEGFGGRRKPAPRHDWAKAPAFVSSNTTTTKPKLHQSEVIDIPEVVVDRDSGSESSGDSTEDEDDQRDAEVDDADGVVDDDGVNDGDDNEQGAGGHPLHSRSTGVWKGMNWSCRIYAGSS